MALAGEPDRRSHFNDGSSRTQKLPRTFDTATNRHNKILSNGFSVRTAVVTWAGQKNTSPAAGRTERHFPSP